MITLTDLVGQWGEQGLVQLPMERYARIFRVQPRTLSPEGVLPVAVPILFTAEVDGEVKLFDTVRIRLGERQTLNLIVLGAVPRDPGLLYCLDASGGTVVLVDVNTPSIEPVNATMALFVEFLLRFAQLIDADSGPGPQRSGRALRLREELAELDPTAFERPDSWWVVAVQQLLTRA
jgi:SUKH-4 immunity protein